MTSSIRASRSRNLAPRGDEGFSVVLVTTTIVVLLILGLAMVSLVSENSGLSVHHVRSSQAFYVAQAGLEYAIKKLSANASWGGLAAPGKNVGPGSFTIARPDSLDEYGNVLPSGQKRIVSTGVVGDATRVVMAKVGTGGMATFAGNGTAAYTGDGGAATSATLRNSEGVTVGPDGSVYIADTDNHVIRKIDGVTGIITTVAGTGSPGWTGSGVPATTTRLQRPQDIAVAANGDLYIADTGNHMIRKVSAATGILTDLAGSGSPGSFGNGGPATLSRLNSPRGIAVAANGDVYIADRGNNQIRKVIAATGVIVAYAGTGTAGFSGDGGLALAAKLRGPQGVELASNGDLYIADTSNHVIRKVAALTTIITRVAGSVSGTSGYSGDGGAATSALLNGPEAVAVGTAGEIYVADRGNNVIRRITAGGSIETVAGTGVAGYSGDGGSPISAMLSDPAGVAVDAAGVAYVADTANQRIRKLAGGFAVVGWVETRT